MDLISTARKSNSPYPCKINHSFNRDGYISSNIRNDAIVSKPMPQLHMRDVLIRNAGTKRRRMAQFGKLQSWGIKAQHKLRYPKRERKKKNNSPLRLHSSSVLPTLTAACYICTTICPIQPFLLAKFHTNTNAKALPLAIDRP